MKSLLVDALRQIEDDATEKPVAKEESSSEKASLELSLDDGSGQTQSSPPASEMVDLALDGEGMLPAVPATEDPADYSVDDSLEIELTTDEGSLSVANDDSSSDAQFDELPAIAGAETRVAPSARYLLLTPLVCLLLGVASAASYLAYKTLGVGATEHTNLAAPAPEVSLANSSIPAAYSFALDTDAVPPPSSSAPVASTSPAATVPVPPSSPVNVVRPSTVQRDPAFELVKQAFSAWQSGDVNAAERLYREALAVSPRHPNALEGLGAVLRHQGQDEAALPIYESLLGLDPGNDVAAAALVATMEQGSDGIAELQRLLARHPNSAPMHDALGEAMAAAGRWPDARLSFERAVEIGPHRADYAFNLAVALDRLGRPGAAETYYRRSLDLATAESGVDRSVVTARLRELAPAPDGAFK